MSSQVSPDSRQNCGFTHVTSKLQTYARGVSQSRHLQGVNDSSALGNAEVEIVTSARVDQRVGVSQGDQRFVGHHRDWRTLSQSRQLVRVAAPDWLFGNSDLELMKG